MSDRVIVLGGGVAGLSAAHELAERGFDVTRLETRDDAGRQGPQHPGTRLCPRRAAAADFPASTGSVSSPASTATSRHDGADPYGQRAGRFATTSSPRRGCSVLEGGREPIATVALPRTFPDLDEAFRFAASTTRPGSGSSRRTPLLRRAAADAAHELRGAALRGVGSAELVGLHGRRARRSGLRQVPRRRPHAHARGRPGARDERPHRRLHPAPAAVRPGEGRRPAPTACSTAPTSDVWIDPWVAHLRARGVGRPPRGPVQAMHSRRRGRGVAGATGAGQRTRPTGTSPRCRWRSCALASAALRAAEPRSRGLDRLVTRWMNGVALLPRPRRAARPRPRHLHRLGVGADLDLAEAVLAPRRPRADGRRPGARDPLGRRLGVARPGQRDRQGRAAVHPRGDLRARCGASSRRASTTARSRVRGGGGRPVPRPEHRVPEPNRGDEPRAAA